MKLLSKLVERYRLYKSRRSHFMRIHIQWNTKKVTLVPILNLESEVGINLDKQEIIFPTTIPIQKAYANLAHAIIAAYPHRDALIRSIMPPGEVIHLEPHMVTPEWLQATRLPYTYKIS